MKTVADEYIEMKDEIASLKQKLEVYEANTARFIAADDAMQQQLAASQATNGKLRELLGEIAKQIPEKPDYWSSCSQCEHNQSDAEDALALPNDDTALKQYRDSVIEECATEALKWLAPTDTVIDEIRNLKEGA